MKYQVWWQHVDHGWDYEDFDNLIDAAEYLADIEATMERLVDTMVTQRVDIPRDD